MTHIHMNCLGTEDAAITALDLRKGLTLCSSVGSCGPQYKQIHLTLTMDDDLRIFVQSYHLQEN